MDFLETLIGRPNTLKTYRSLFNRHIEPAIARVPTWNKKEVLFEIQYWDSMGFSKNTIKTLTTLLCRYIEWKQGTVVSIKHTLRTVSRKTQDEPPELPTKDTIYQLLDLVRSDDPELYTPMFVAVYTGMRKGEIMGLSWQDVDFIKNSVTIRRSYGGPTKNGKTRVIPLHPKLKQLFMDIWQNKSDNYLENKVITKQFDPNKNLQRFCKRIKIKPFTFHTLRHCFASYGLEGGLDFNKIQKILGHSNLSTTVNFYWTTKFKPEEVNLDFI